MLQTQRGDARYTRPGSGAVRYWLDVSVDALRTAAGVRWRSALHREGAAPHPDDRDRPTDDGSRWREDPRRQARRGMRLDAVVQDVRFALRGLARRRGFAAVSLLTLGLGVGATVALLGIVHALLLRPLPLEHGERTVVLRPDGSWRASEYEAVREMDLEAIERVAAWTTFGATLRSTDRSTVVRIGLLGPASHEALGAQPLMGRLFVPEEHEPRADAVAVVSHGLWSAELGGDPAVLGRRIYVDGHPVNVVGVMPEGFFFPAPDVRLWQPLEIDPRSPVYLGRSWLALAGRLRTGATEAALERDLGRVAAMLEDRFEYPARVEAGRLGAVPLRHHLLGDTRTALLLLVGAVALLLAAASTNVAALLVARAADRAEELSVRASLGAGRGRLAGQLLTEGVVLGLLGGVLAAAFASGMHRLLLTRLPLDAGLDSLPTLGWETASGAAIASALIGMGAAALPLAMLLSGGIGALHDGGSAPGLRLGRSSGRSLGRTVRVRRAQSALVAAQVAIALTLLSGATLMARSVEKLLDARLGLDPEGVVVANVAVAGRTGAERAQFFLGLLERIGSRADVAAAGLLSQLPLRDPGGQGPVHVEDRPELRDMAAPYAYFRAISPGVLEALGVPLEAGRAFGEADRAGDGDVAIVSASFARAVWPGQDPLGKRIISIGWEASERWSTVVGVAGDVRLDGPAHEAGGVVYRPVAQWGTRLEMVLAARTDAGGAVLEAVRAEAAALDPLAAVHRTATMEDVLGAAVRGPMRLRFFLSLFGALALLLGMGGVYGVVSHAVGSRMREYGVRMVLGARAAELVRAETRRGVRPVAAGVLIGLVVSVSGARVLSTFLFEVAPSDPASYATAALVLLLAGAGAAWAPALRAGRVDPVVSMRVE